MILGNIHRLLFARTSKSCSLMTLRSSDDPISSVPLPRALFSRTGGNDLPEIPVHRRFPGGLIVVSELRGMGAAVSALDIHAPAALLLDAPHTAASGTVRQVDLVKVFHTLSSCCLFDILLLKNNLEKRCRKW